MLSEASRHNTNISERELLFQYPHDVFTVDNFLKTKQNEKEHKCFGQRGNKRDFYFNVILSSFYFII